jgi:hypothetical protein
MMSGSWIHSQIAYPFAQLHPSLLLPAELRKQETLMDDI